MEYTKESLANTCIRCTGKLQGKRLSTIIIWDGNLRKK
jgi:hypothetical protein